MRKWIIPLILAIYLASCENVMTVQTLDGVNLPITYARPVKKVKKTAIKTTIDNPNDHTQAKSFWTPNTYAWRDKLIKLGYTRNLASYVINRCKQQARNAEHCIVTAGFIGYAESTAWQSAFQNNVWGINEGKAYTTKGENFERWFKSYNKHWYKTKWPHEFYPPLGGVSRTKYCTSDSGWKKGCPDGLKNSTKAFNQLLK